MHSEHNHSTAEVEKMRRSFDMLVLSKNTTELLACKKELHRAWEDLQKAIHRESYCLLNTPL